MHEFCSLLEREIQGAGFALTESMRRVSVTEKAEIRTMLKRSKQV